MASGDTLAIFTPLQNEPAATSGATIDNRPTTGSPVNWRPVLEFDASADETAIFTALMPRNYGAGTSINVIIFWVSDASSSGSVMFSVSIERCDSALDLDGDSFATAINGAAVTTSGTLGTGTYTSITLTNAEADAIAAGEWFRLRVARVTASDTMASDAQIVGIEIKQA